MKKNTRKLLAVVLSFVLLVAGIPVGGISAFASDEVPEGYIGVYNIEDLNNIRNNLTENYILMNDIDMTEATSEGGAYYNNGNGWKPIGSSSSSPFSGVFDGNGHTIKSMQIRDIKTEYVGLFGYVTGEIENLSLKDVRIECNLNTVKYIGAITGYMNNGNIFGVSVTGELSISDQSSHYNGYSGGIVGYCYGNSTIRESYNHSDVYVGTNLGGGAGSSVGVYAGGISGRGGIIIDCYNTGNISADCGYYRNSLPNYYAAVSGGICGSEATVNRCLNIGTIKAAAGTQNPSRDHIYRSSAIAYSTVSECYYLDNSAQSGVYGKTDTATTAVALSESQLSKKSAFYFLNFENIWFIDTNTGINHPQLLNNPEVVAESVEIKTPAEKTVYCLGDELDISGLTLSVKLADKDTIYTKTPTVSMVSGFDSETPGEKTLTVRYYNKAVTYNVTVLPVAPESITLNKTSAELERGQKVTLTVTLTPSDAADSITWTSSADTVASVDENGVVTALSAGEAVITAETINGLKAACTVTVNASSLPGDANGDGQINAADRMALSRYLAKMGELADPGAADLDGDGNVTAADRMILSRYLAKWSGYDSYFQA